MRAWTLAFSLGLVAVVCTCWRTLAAVVGSYLQRLSTTTTPPLITTWVFSQFQ